jgi:autotransporter-associated beta strand protein
MKTTPLHAPVSLSTSPSATGVARVRFLALTATLLLAAHSRAATLSWSGASATTGNWNDSANWGFAGTPANGDTLIFPAAQPRQNNTNNIVGLTLNQIRFVGPGGGYQIFGNALTITNSIEATNSLGINWLSNNITLGSPTDFVVDVGTGAKLVLGGTLSGTVGLIKNGGGTNQLAGGFSNTYVGTTTVNNGLMELFKNGAGVQAIPHDLVIGNGTFSATVRNQAVLEIADSANVTVNKLSLLDLDDHSETIGTHLTLQDGGDVSTGLGTLILSPNAVITVNPGALAGDSVISGNLNLGSGTCTIDVGQVVLGGGLNISALVSGTSTINKTGLGSLFLTASNSFTGQFNIGNGLVFIDNDFSLGSTNGSTTISNTAQLEIGGNIDVLGENLTNASTSSQSLWVTSGTNSWSGTNVFAANTGINVYTNSYLTLSGWLQGSGGFTKIGPGILELAGPSSSSSYTGDSTVKEGILLLNSGNVIRFGTLTIGDGIGGADADVVRYLRAGCIFGGAGGSTVAIKSSGLLDLNGFNDDVGPIDMDGGDIFTGAGVLTLFQPLTTRLTSATNGSCAISGKLRLRSDSTFGVSNSLSIPAALDSPSGGFTLTKTGPANMFLQSSNAFTGLLVIQDGWVWAENAFALGDPTNGVVVSKGASLVLQGNFGITNEALTLNGAGASADWGALDAETSGTNIWAGPITVNGDCTIAPYESNTVLQIVGAISGPGGVREFTGSSFQVYSNWGTLHFQGPANTYAGVTHVDSGTLLLEKTAFDGACPGGLVIGDGNGGANADVVRYLHINQVPNSANVTVNSSGLLDLNGFVEGLGSLTGTGNVNFGAGLLDMYGNTSYSFDGVISGSGNFRQFGSGIITLTGANTYTGKTRVASSGKIFVNGSQPSSDGSVESALGTLGGTGTIGDISCVGHLAPGSSPGILTCSNLFLTSNATFNVEISGRNPGTGYDQLNVRGTNNLGSAHLSVSVNMTNPVTVGDELLIINNDGFDAITGTFTSLPEGSAISSGGFTFVLSYVGGTGNDVSLTVTNVPGGLVGSSLTGGNGNAIIDANECNSLNIIITNRTATPMTGISATLSSSTLGALVTQPYSAYPDAPANGKSTNSTAFQLSTVAPFLCGTNIALQLTVSSASHGDFTLPLVLASGEPGATPTRLDNNSITNIPDIGTIESTNVVSAFSTPITKVAVSMWLTHPVDSDLNISLIAPDGTTVDLSSGNGDGANFGSACSPDSSRTTFDDAAATAIRPEGSLSVLNGLVGTTVNGNWRLRITDNFAGSLGSLRCWSLFLYPTVCAAASGGCGFCLPPVSGSITTNDPIQTGRLARNNLVASCGLEKTCPVLNDNLGHHYRLHTFTNDSGADACITISLTTSCGLNAYAVAYLGSFNPTNLCENYLGDAGASGPSAFSVFVPAGATYLVDVLQISSNALCSSYSLQLSGLPCPVTTPTLNIQAVPANQARLFWTNAAVGFQLESTPSLQPTNWTPVTNVPMDNGGNLNVTNDTTATNRFYRLRKP